MLKKMFTYYLKGKTLLSMHANYFQVESEILKSKISRKEEEKDHSSTLVIKALLTLKTKHSCKIL